MALTHPKELEIAFLAGFFDGESCITSNCSSQGYGLRICVANKVRKSLDRYKELWGGIIVTKSTGIHFEWRLLAQLPQKQFLESVQPFCLVKKPVIELALYWIGQSKKGKDFTIDDILLRDELIALLHQLNKRTPRSNAEVSIGLDT